MLYSNSMRDRLIELINQARTEVAFFTSDGKFVMKNQRLIVDRAEAGDLADHLIANGLIVPPCKAGDELDGKIVDQVTYKTMVNFNGSITTVQEVELRRMDENRHIYTTTTISFDEAERLKQEG